MANDIDRIITVNITRQTTVPSMASFSDALVAAEFLKADIVPVMTDAQRVRSYSSVAELEAAGFDSDTFIGKAALAWFSQNPAPNKIYIGRKLKGADGTEDWDDALAAMVADDNSWYGLIAETRAKADQEIIGTWVEANTKLYIAASADADIVDVIGDDDIAEVFHAASLDRSAAFYHPDVGGADECVPEAAWISKLFAKNPGVATWAYKTLATIPVYALNSGQISKAVDKKANIYTSIADVNVTQFGTVGSGEYIDVIHGVDWLKAVIQQRIFTPIVQLDKVPYTDTGVEIGVSQLKAALEVAVSRGILASYEVTFPAVADVAPADKAARLLPDIRFSGILAGAIHKVHVDGIVTL